jgi:hypothetical protein
MADKYTTERGFSLIAVLLLMMLMSGLALSMMYMVHIEGRTGSGDLENNLAYHAAEGGMEKMTADLATLYSTSQSPTVLQIQGLGGYPPVLSGVSFLDYSIKVPLNSQGQPATTIDNVHSGPNAGLVAEITPMTLSVTAQRPLGDQVRMVRTVEVAQIPVFQFGVFSDSDLSYFPGPDFAFGGRVHTNGNLFLAAGGTLAFSDQVTAVGEVVRAQLSNGWPTSSNYTGPVYIPKAPSGCAAVPSDTCVNLGLAQGSVVGGIPSAATPGWSGISISYNGYLMNRATGATALSLPFVGGGASPVQIIRRPPAGEAAASLTGSSRLYNQAAIRILLSDTAAENHPNGTAVDAQDIELASKVPAALLAGGSGWAQNGVNVSGVGTSYFAEANIDCSGGKPCEPVCKPATAYQLDFVPPPNFHGAATPGYSYPAGANPTQAQLNAVTPKEWPMVDGFLRVEIRKADGTYMAVTQEWLQLGFARGLLPPNSANATPNNVHPKAVLIFQMQADRNLDGQFKAAQNESGAITGANSQYNWFPINFYDVREGEARDTDAGNGTCSSNGVINEVELDVLNLQKWLAGTYGGNGSLTDVTTQNGYVLYFSDRRGMRANTNLSPAVKTGEYGFEDVVNAGTSAGTPDGKLEANNPGTSLSAEDVNQNKLLDTWGVYNVGEAFGPTFAADTHANPPNPFLHRMTCTTLARKNTVTGARHALMLVNGSRGNLPVKPDGTGGFTVASENPVYILGDYNAKASENKWGDPHAAASVIADAVTLLSNGWSQVNSLANSTLPGSRVATTTWYRTAIAAGKNISFPRPASWSSAQDFGTDGGMHNFLRYIEDWGNATLNYEGSLVSLYYSQYATGVFKCCTVVYSPPTRNYLFDQLFLTPSNLPPGTPMFRDVVNVSYRQDFTPY